MNTISLYLDTFIRDSGGRQYMMYIVLCLPLNMRLSLETSSAHPLRNHLLTLGWVYLYDISPSASKRLDISM